MGEKSKLALAQESFKAVLDSDVHLDNKASRTLSGMAFLTAAAAAIFARTSSAGFSRGDVLQSFTQILAKYATQPTGPIANELIANIDKPNIFIFGISWPLAAFALYMFFAVLGALLYLAALGPSLNLPEFFRKVPEGVSSLVFFKAIGELKSEVWKGHWNKKSAEELENDMLDNLIFETHLIAQKTVAKYHLMSTGSVFFKMAIVCLLYIVSGFLSDNINIVRGFIVSTTLINAILLGYETAIRPSIHAKPLKIVLLLLSVAVACLIAYLLG